MNRLNFEESAASKHRPDTDGAVYIHPEALLGRTQTVLDTGRIRESVREKTILVTGGAGSIGSELCRQALDFGCRKLIIFDINENGLFALDYVLKKKFDQARYDIAVGSVRDYGRLSEIFGRDEIHTVFHTAAHKHVPLMETNPAEAIKNNIFGTLNVAENAVRHNAGKLILISSDKAVNCAGIMGATKRIAEMIVQWLDAESAFTKLAAVRFGNVLGSNGSVIPTFQNQIREGGPVTVTHPEIERYFMTVMEAVQLVLQAGSMVEGGEIFVLDMGKPIKIVDLANNMIRLSGMKPGRDIMLEFTGLRPGEKLFEELSTQNETLRRTENDKILVCDPTELSRDFMRRLHQLKNTVESENAADYKALLDEIIAGSVQTD